MNDPSPVPWSEFNRVVAQLSAQIADLEERLHNHVHDVKGMNNVRTGRPRPKDYLD